MKTKEEMHKALEDWWSNDTVGNIIMYRAPHARTGDVILEKVVKAREMKPHVRAAFELVMVLTVQYIILVHIHRCAGIDFVCTAVPVNYFFLAENIHERPVMGGFIYKIPVG